MPHPQTSPGVYWDKPRAVVAADGAEIRYTVLHDHDGGDGPVVALLSGYLCPDTWWHDLVGVLRGEGYRVLLLHYRGIGSSSAPSVVSAETISIERFAADVLDVLHDAGVREVSMVGHSMGAQVMLEVAGRIGSRVRSMATVTGAYRSPMKDLYGAGWLFDPLAHVVTRVLGAGPIGPVGAVWRAAWRLLPFAPTMRLVGAFGPDAPPEVLASYAEHARQIDPSVVLAMTEALHRHDPGDLLERLDIPTLVLTGTRDPFTPVRVAKAMVRRMPHARLEVVEGATHAAILERPEEVNAALLGHLAEHHPA